MQIIQLKKGKEKSILRKHPWVFSGAIRSNTRNLENGEHVLVQDFQENTIAVGHYHHASIAVRILAFEELVIDQDFYNKKMNTALQKRKLLGLPSTKTNAFRLVAGEGDMLSGLIIDYYNGHCVVQCHTEGMLADINLIRFALQSVLKDDLQTIYLKNIHIKKDQDEAQLLFGTAEKALIVENGHTFEIDWVHGQKTGFFLDQRVNRQLIGDYSRGKKVLNAYCYTGGFSVYALNNGAELVDSVDISDTAIQQALKNISLNGDFDHHNGYTEDVIDFLKKMNQDYYDLIILDPPAFAKSRKKTNNAINAYKRINALAMKNIKKGGLLFTFSCSQVISRDTFEHTIRSAAIEVGRDISIIHHLSQSPDHTANVYHPEGHYLKGLGLIIN